MYALINSSGYIVDISLKPTIGGLKEGFTIVQYNPPPSDPKLYQVSPVQPVTTAEVEFTVVPNHKALVEFYLEKVDKDVDFIYGKAIGNRGPEYTQAEKEALDYKASGYLDPAPPYVSSWAEATGISNTAAADGIIAQAAYWRNASLMIRTNRLRTKESIRLGDYGAIGSWDTFTSDIRKQLNI